MTSNKNKKQQPHHDAFTALALEEQERVVKLASILRIADSLDREHT